MNKKIIKTDYIPQEKEVNHGIIQGNVHVNSGIKFINHGILSKNVILENGAQFINYGTVNESITGYGYAEIFGVVSGNISGNVNCYIHKDAIVNSVKYNHDERR